MGRCDFIYEWQVKSCPIDEDTAEKILQWMGINPSDAEKYCGVSSRRALLYKCSQDMKAGLYPPEYQTTGFDRQ